MEVKIGVKERKDSNEREGGYFVVLEEVHCWKGGGCNRVRKRRRFKIKLSFVSNDLWNDDNG